MDRLTREEIIAAWNEAVPESKDKGIEMYLHLMQAVADAQYRKCSLSLESVRSEGLEEKFWVVEAVNEDDTVLSPPAYWYGGFVGSTVAGHVGSDIQALCTRFQNAQTAEYVKCLLRNAKIQPDRGHHWKIFKHIALSPARVAEGKCVYPEECAHFGRCIKTEDHDNPPPCKLPESPAKESVADAPVTVGFKVKIRADGEIGRLTVEQYDQKIVLTSEQAVALVAQIQEKLKP